jgi:hypothetical protein
VSLVEFSEKVMKSSNLPMMLRIEQQRKGVRPRTALTTPTIASNSSSASSQRPSGKRMRHNVTNSRG